MPKFSPGRPAIVYLAVNCLTKERYIGVTTQTLDKRRRGHYRAAKNGHAYGIFCKALRDHPANAFDWSVLVEADDVLDAARLEQDLIKEMHPEYNATKGGQGYHPKMTSDEERARLREEGLRNKERFMQYARLGPKAMARRVVCLNDGKVYDSIRVAADAYDQNHGAIVEMCQRKRYRRTLGGYVFLYEEDASNADEQLRKALYGAGRGGNNPYRGVHPHYSEGKFTGRWRARLSIGTREKRKNLHLGIFDTPEEAHAARQSALKAHGRKF